MSYVYGDKSLDFVEACILFQIPHFHKPVIRKVIIFILKFLDCFQFSIFSLFSGVDGADRNAKMIHLYFVLATNFPPKGPITVKRQEMTFLFFGLRI